MRKTIIIFTIIFAFPVTNVWAADCGYSCAEAGGIGQKNSLTCRTSTHVYKCAAQDGKTYACVTNATIIGTGAAAECKCNKNYYQPSPTSDECTPCTDGFTTAGPGAVGEGLCTKTCTSITVKNGIGGQPASPSINQTDDNGCDYDITCNSGYNPHDITYHNINETTEYACTANNYTVSYNCGTGSGGSTANSAHTYDTEKDLTLNGCTRSDGRTFQGWDDNSNAATVKYDDGESVINLTDIQNATVTLYAVWGNCPNSANAVEWTPDSCTITKCDSGYKLDGAGNSTTCTECVTHGSYCTDGVNQFSCEKGYYCENGKTRTACPPGKTTDNTGSPSADECHYVTVSEAGGASANATQFCDGSGTHCFTLP